MTDDELRWHDEEEDDDDPHAPAAWQRRLHDPRTTDELVRVALFDEGGEFLEALMTLQIRGGREVLDAARTLCAGPVAEGRKLGAMILSRLGDTAPMLRVARRLRMSGQEEMWSYAEELERKFGPGAEDIHPYPKEALATLLPMLETEEDIETLREVICAIAEYQDFHDSITEHIAALHTHPNSKVRFTVSTRLALNIEHPAAKRTLKLLAKDEDEDVRRSAKEWLKMLRMMEKE